MIDLDTQMYEVRARVHHLGGLFWVCGSAALVEVVLLRGEGRAKKALAVALQRRYAQMGVEVSVTITGAATILLGECDGTYCAFNCSTSN
jgi:metallo-beta-lactamase family protein